MRALKHDPQVRDARRSALALWLAAALAVALLLAQGVWRHGGQASNGFAAYYTSAWLVEHGADPNHFYDDDWFRAQLPRAGIVGVSDIYNVNPPTTALLFTPLAPLAPRAAAWAWLALSLACLAGAVLVILRALRAVAGGAPRSSLIAPAFVGLVCVYNPLYFNLQQGQIYTLLLLLTACAFRGYLRQDDRTLGVSLGLLLLFKGSGALLWLAPLLDRRLRALVYGVATVVAGVALTAPLLGLDAWLTYVRLLPSLFNQPWSGVTAYQTLASLVHHLTQADAGYNPRPLLRAGAIAAPLTTLLNLALALGAVAVGWVFIDRRGLPDDWRRAARFALLAALAVPVAPVGEEYHYLLLLVPVAVALALLSGQVVSGARRALLAAPAMLGVLALAFPLPFRATQLEYGWRALFAYPKVYGALLLALALAIALVMEPGRWAVRQRLRQAARDLRPLLRRPDRAG